MATKANEHRKAARKLRWLNGEERKVLRRKAGEAAAKANAEAGRTPKRQTRKRKADNTRVCARCNMRTIVAGQVCVCQRIGAR